MPKITPLIAGNWKMNGLTPALDEARLLVEALKSIEARAEIMIFPPTTLLAKLNEAFPQKESGIAFGGQDCHAALAGAHTGDISAKMLSDVGARAVILGHSERRTAYRESDEDIHAKAMAAWDAGLTRIICVGESFAQREAGKTLPHIETQLRGSLPDDCTGENTVIAYEPIWAIGSGLTPSPDEIAEVHHAMRAALADRFGDAGGKMRLLYGGSVNPNNAAELLRVSEVNGALVGGASLRAEDFLNIIAACP